MSQNALQAVLDRAARDPAPAVAPESKAPAAAKPVRAKRAAASPRVVAPAEEAQAPKFYRPSRDGRRFIGGHFHNSVGKQLKLIAVEDDTTVQALLEEALDLLFIKKGKSKVADLSS